MQTVMFSLIIYFITAAKLDKIFATYNDEGLLQTYIT